MVWPTKHTPIMYGCLCNSQIAKWNCPHLFNNSHPPYSLFACIKYCIVFSVFTNTDLHRRHVLKRPSIIHIQTFHYWGKKPLAFLCWEIRVLTYLTHKGSIWGPALPLQIILSNMHFESNLKTHYRLQLHDSLIEQSTRQLGYTHLKSFL